MRVIIDVMEAARELYITVKMYPCSGGTGFFRTFPLSYPLEYISFAANKESVKVFL